MADMDLDDLLVVPTQGPSRPARFAPKGSKFKPTVSTKKEEPKEEADARPEYEKNEVEMDFEVEVKPDEENENEIKEKMIDDLMETDEAEGEGPDDIVREIDVYFAPSIDPYTRLYVLQYPLRPVWRPYELEDRCEEVRVKPASSEFEIDLAVNFDSDNYDRDADPRVQIMKQTLASSWKPPRTSGYAVGVLRGNKLHLNPIHSVVQLRPSMQHLKPRDSKNKKTETGSVEEPMEEKSLEASKKQTKPSGQNKDSGEHWVPLKYHNARSDIADRYLQKMAAQEGSPINFSMSSRDYLNRLCPGTSSENFRSKVPTRRFLMTLPLKERCRTWLLEGSPIHRYDALKHLAPDESVEEVLEVLQEYARLVQGLWVPKSSLVYGTDSGIEVLARDYVLLLFSKNPLVNNSQIPQRPQLAKAMKDVLNVLAVERPSFSDWKLRELPDRRFLKLNPTVAKQQEEEWESLEKKINDLLFGGRSGPGAKTYSKSNVINNPATSMSSSRVALKTPNGASSRTPMPEETREALMKALQKLFKSIKVCSFQQICQRLRDLADSESARSRGFAKETVAAANSICAFADELQAIISRFAFNIHGVYVPKLLQIIHNMIHSGRLSLIFLLLKDQKQNSKRFP
ncbi:DNA-directed RNA polymerase III subunit RPC5-like [Olea europaea var. sylvestris]|uniref:DNA-directed RNA polymerase III subunit RPC5-like n=1 Tax=Olea europaea var. sylvestris TaxID=158386 RepID=UPI000C1D2707|nr:DNA-directed RNA polymerase III subunit RPC5-like [Olea europaea var. sylvestris]XP_022870608.1 DNA-directed RNA polymerase III subunit RPC5-like [Olea europaea var. sylvestris]